MLQTKPKAMSNFKRMVFKLDPDNREAEGQLVERYLTALGYEDAETWNDERRHDNTRKHIFVDGVKFMYFTDDCHELATIEPTPTPYQVAVAEHMATAPQELAEYVRGRLVSGDWWRDGKDPILECGFSFIESVEGSDFWGFICNNDWQHAMATDFWRSRTAPSEAPTIEFEKPEHPEEYDYINPAHYQEFSIEVIDMMAAIWGKEATATHCEMCAFKYKLRAGSKPDQPIERDLEKAAWYLSKAKELRDA